MTERKHLKARVRARSARTGETYTTARRHVLAGAPSPSGQSHDSTLIARLLAGSGVTTPTTGGPFSEAAVLGLAGGLGFMYASFAYAGTAPTMTVVVRSHPRPLAETLLDRLGVAHAVRRTGSPQRAASTLLADLATGRPVLCAVTRDRLPGRDPDPLAGHDEHLVLVTEVDGDVAVVDDGGQSPLSVPLDVLATARGAKRGAKHRAILVEDATVPVELGGAVREALGQTVANLTQPVLGNAFDVNFGFRGMQRWLDLLVDRTTPDGWPRRFAADPAVFASTCHALAGWVAGSTWAGPGALRPLYADFLGEAAHVLGGSAGLHDAAAAFRASGSRWDEIAATAAAVTPEHDSAEVLAALAGAVADVLATERRAVTALGSVVG